MGVDAMATSYPGMNPYNFVMGNPISVLDPDGRAPVPGDPVKNPQIAPSSGSGKGGGRFGHTRSGGRKYHGGIDILAAKGTQLKAMKAGTVVDVRSSFKPGQYAANSLGNFVVIKSTLDDGSDIYIKYGHLDNVDVKVGQELEEGEVFGKSGDTGNAGYNPKTGKRGIAIRNHHVHIEASTTSQFFPGKGNGGTEKDTRINPEQFFDTQFDGGGNPIKSPSVGGNFNPNKHNNGEKL